MVARLSLGQKTTVPNDGEQTAIMSFWVSKIKFPLILKRENLFNNDAKMGNRLRKQC